MRRRLVWLLPAALLPAALFAVAADAQRAPLFDSVDETRAAMRDALAERQAAEQRSARLEAEARAARNAAEKTAREAAALAARIQQAEAGVAAAQARLALVDGERAHLREQLGVEQRPVIRLTAALQQFSRRPVSVSLLRPGSVKEVVYLRAVLDSAVPEVRARTATLRARIARSRQLRREAQDAADVMQAEEQRLAQRRVQLAAIESKQRLASRQAGGTAAREAERALALGEKARDLDALVGELDRAGALRSRLAALPGPVLRPERPEQAQVAFTSPSPTNSPAERPPRPYMLPVTGRTITGFGAPLAAGFSRGVTLAPRGGAQVVAPAAGRVAFAGPYRGYDQIVIIEHDGGWTSLVTGLARADARVGDLLVAGAPLGVAGPGRPTVTLELRRDGEPLNPLRFVG